MQCLFGTMQLQVCPCSQVMQHCKLLHVIADCQIIDGMLCVFLSCPTRPEAWSQAPPEDPAAASDIDLGTGCNIVRSTVVCVPR